jgi:hypothetical protein
MQTIYQLQDDKKSTFKDKKGTVSKTREKKSERHTLTLNGRTYFYSGDVGYAALETDFEQLKELGFIE